MTRYHATVESLSPAAETFGYLAAFSNAADWDPPNGGMLRLLYPLFEAGLGGRLGRGEQWLSWIGLDDLLDIYLRAIIDAALSGPVNAVAPTPVRNAEYTAVLAGLLHRPALVPVPGSVPGCCSAPRAPARSPRPASTSGRSG
jgi:hypothetical protein